MLDKKRSETSAQPGTIWKDDFKNIHYHHLSRHCRTGIVRDSNVRFGKASDD